MYASKGPVVEEWADRRFFRPVGWRLATALLPTRISADAVTLASLVLGVFAGHLFWYRSALVNAAGVLLFILSDVLDSVDGQLARMTGDLWYVGDRADLAPCGVAAYASQKLSDTCTFNARGEWFDDTDGARGLGTNIYEVTLGVTITPNYVSMIKGGMRKGKKRAKRMERILKTAGRKGTSRSRNNSN